MLTKEVIKNAISGLPLNSAYYVAVTPSADGESVSDAWCSMRAVSMGLVDLIDRRFEINTIAIKVIDGNAELTASRLAEIQ